MGQWKHEYTEPPVDLRLLGSRPSEDWRHELSMAIQAFADSAHKIADALNGSPEKAAYIRANARQFGEPLPLQLVCSVWMVMEKLDAAE